LTSADASKITSRKCNGWRIYLGQMRRTIRLLGSLPADTIEPASMKLLPEAFRHWRA
jgi:hypothetical protein